MRRGIEQLLTTGENRNADSSPRYLGSGPWSQLPIKARIGDTYLLSDAWVSNGSVQTAKVSILMQFKANDSTQPWEPFDLTNESPITFGGAAVTLASTSNFWTEYTHFTALAAMTFRASFGAFISGEGGETQGMAMGTTSAGTDIVSTVTGVGVTAQGVFTAGADTTLAAAASVYFNWRDSAAGSAHCVAFNLLLKKLAGNL